MPGKRAIAQRPAHAARQSQPWPCWILYPACFTFSRMPHAACLHSTHAPFWENYSGHDTLGQRLIKRQRVFQRQWPKEWREQFGRHRISVFFKDGLLALELCYINRLQDRYWQIGPRTIFKIEDFIFIIYTIYVINNTQTYITQVSCPSCYDSYI